MADVLIAAAIPKGRKMLGLQTPGFDASIASANNFKDSVQNEVIPLGTLVEYENGDQYMYVKVSTDINASAAAIPVKIDLTTYVASASGAAGRIEGVIEQTANVDGTPTAKYGWVKTAGKVVDCSVGTLAALGALVSFIADGSGRATVIPTTIATSGDNGVRGVALEAAASNEADIYLYKIF
jgi:hypothetical protein